MTPIEHLKSLKMEDNRRRNPNFPEAYRPPAKYEDRTANGLTKCVIDFINLSGYQAERIASSGRVIKSKGREFWIPGSTRNGTADISATIKGRSVKIEVKIGKDKQSEDQKDYQAEVERAGGIYIIVKSFNDLYTWFQEFTSKNA